MNTDPGPVDGFDPGAAGEGFLNEKVLAEIPEPERGERGFSEDTTAIEVRASSNTVCKTRKIPVVRFKKT